MKIQIVTPAARGTTLGNRITANRWKRILRGLGYRVDVTTNFQPSQSADILIALHATRSHDSILRWKERHANRPLAVCMTGTDLHVDLQCKPDSRPRRLATQSLEIADRVILLEPAGLQSLPTKRLNDLVKSKSSVIFQSAQPVRNPPPPLKTRFEVSVIGHLRKVKDPFLAARAAKHLPPESTIQIVHFGQALDPQIEREANQLQHSIPRYRWLGPRPHAETMRRLARSRVTLLTSRVEGAPSAISEAIVNNVPILSTRIPATVGLLGEGYPGLFPVGAEKQLASLLNQVESDPTFLALLKKHTKKLRPQFKIEAEVRSWKKLLKEIRFDQ